MSTPYVRIIQGSDRQHVAAMRFELWPDQSLEQHRAELDAELDAGMTGTLPRTILVSVAEDGSPTGFLEVGLRSHADGCDITQPVGFVEGWYVDQASRKRGVGGQLMRAAEEWSRARGCREMASDALIDNLESQSAHQALGFEVVDRCVHYRKPL
jgi:aminoglycoside 6'-N-acetyltransferase I